MRSTLIIWFDDLSIRSWISATKLAEIVTVFFGELETQDV